MRMWLDTSVKRGEACTVPKPIDVIFVYDICTKDSLRVKKNYTNNVLKQQFLSWTVDIQL